MSEEKNPVIEGEVVGPASRDVVVRHDPFTPQHVIDSTIEDPAGEAELLKAGLAEATWRRYRVAWRHFLLWCTTNGRHHIPVPATLDVLRNYVRWLTKYGGVDGTGAAVSTIRIHLAAIKIVHAFGEPSSPWAGDHPKIAKMIVGYANTRGKAPKRADGARGEILRLLVDTCERATTTGVRDRAILLLGYYMAARRSELAALTIGDLRYTEEGVEVYIARSKTDQAAEGASVAVPANDDNPDYCAVRAVDDWVTRLERDGVTDGMLFRAIDRYGNIRHASAPLSGTTFEGVWARAVGRAIAKADAAKDKRLAIRLRKLRLTPHSGRRGFATDARDAEWDLLDISRHGRWSPQSKVVHVYIEEADKWKRHRNKPVKL